MHLHPRSMTLAALLSLLTLGCDDTPPEGPADAAAIEDSGTGGGQGDATVPQPDAGPTIDPALCETAFEVAGCPCDGSEQAVCCGGQDALRCVDGAWRFMRVRACNPNVDDDAGTRPRRAQCDFGS